VDRYLGSRSVGCGGSDEAVACYAVAVKPAVDALVGMTAQISAALLAVTAGLRDSSPAGALLGAARALHTEALEHLQTVRVPKNAEHYHRHLVHAAALIGSALLEASHTRLLCGVDLDNVLVRLRRGWSELDRATAALPGLSVLNLEQCCAGHVTSHAGWMVQS